MGPVEVFWFAIFLFFVLIALVRGYDRELGVTTLIFAALFIITMFGEEYLPRILDAITSALGNPPLETRVEQHLLSFTFSVFFLAVIFAAYAGDTFSFQGKLQRGRGSIILDLLIGVLNGYLVAGSLWYFQDQYAYPAADFGLLALPLTSLGETMATYLPPYVAPPLFWGVMVMLLLLLRVRK